MGLFDKVNQVSRSVSESSKSAAETSNLKKKIAYEKERIQEVMTEIGRLFYENPNGDHKAELELCADIDDRKRRIASMQGDLVFVSAESAARGLMRSILLVSAATAAQS